MRFHAAAKPAVRAGGFIYYVEDDAKGGTLPAAVGAEDAVHVALFYFEGSIFYGVHFAETLIEVADGKDGFQWLWVCFIGRTKTEPFCYRKF